MARHVTDEERERARKGGEWLAEQRVLHGFKTGTSFAEALGIRQARLSTYENGLHIVETGVARRVAEVFGMPETEVWRHLGLPLPQDYEEPAQTPSTLDAIMADPDLDDETRQHFANQYRILTSLTEHRRQVESPDVPLPPEEATLAGVDPDSDAADPADDPADEVREPARRRSARR